MSTRSPTKIGQRLAVVRDCSGSVVVVSVPAAVPVAVAPPALAVVAEEANAGVGFSCSDQYRSIGRHRTGYLSLLGD